MHYDIFIVGSGPAGLTAAIYGARAGFSVAVAEQALPGGQMSQTHLIENYPGFPEGIDGFSLGELFAKQAKQWGAELLPEAVKELTPKDALWQIKTNRGEYTADSVILASGAKPRTLGVPGEEKYRGFGVSYCGTCDGPLYRNKDVIIIGGGNAAFQEADFLLKFIKNLTIIGHSSEFKAQKALIDKITAHENVTLLPNRDTLEILGDDYATGVKVFNKVTNITETISAEGVFVFIGHAPDTSLYKNLTETDASGRILTDNGCACSPKGLYAIGDVRSKEVFQIATAVGDGATVIHTIQSQR